MRELTFREMEEVNGGVIPLVVIAVVKLAGTAAVVGFGAALGAWAFNKISGGSGC